jgi:hypothetical protein
MNTKIQALAKFLDCGKSEITKNSNNNYSLGRQEYLVLTDGEADEAAKEYIKDSLWAFKASFLAGETELPEECFAALSEKCESGNDAMLQIVKKTCGLDSLVESAIRADGRGHFLSGYDGKEREETIERETFYIYRTN